MKRSLILAAAAAFLALPAFACEDIHVDDAYARASTAMSQSGAAFMTIINHGDQDRRVIGARSDIAQRVELHTHVADAAGVMRMVEVQEGFLIPAGGAHVLQRGGDHVMFLGLNRPMNHGDVITVTLVFEQGDDLEIEIPVDLERQAGAAAHGGHTHTHGHGHGAPSN